MQVTFQGNLELLGFIFSQQAIVDKYTGQFFTDTFCGTGTVVVDVQVAGVLEASISINCDDPDGTYESSEEGASPTPTN